MDGFREGVPLRSYVRALAAGPGGDAAIPPAAPPTAPRAEPEPRCGFRLEAAPGVADLDRNGRPEAAVYELQRLDDAVWRHGFLAFLRHRHEAEPARDGGPPGGAGLAARLAVAGDARMLRKTRAVMEAAHRGRVLSLAWLARAGDGPVEDRRKREVGLRERVLWPMDELGAWDVSEAPRTPRQPARAPAGSGGGVARPVARGVALRHRGGAGVGRLRRIALPALAPAATRAPGRNHRPRRGLMPGRRLCCVGVG